MNTNSEEYIRLTVYISGESQIKKNNFLRRILNKITFGKVKLYGIKIFLYDNNFDFNSEQKCTEGWNFFRIKK